MQNCSLMCFCVLAIALIGQAPFTSAASTDPCVSATMNMVGVCGSFVSKVQNAAKTLVGDPDADIAAAAAQIPPPTTQCCGVYRDFLSGGCNCDKGVLALAAAQSTPEQAVATQTRVWKVACNIAPSFDHCAVAASSSTLG